HQTRARHQGGREEARLRARRACGRCRARRLTYPAMNMDMKVEDYFAYPDSRGRYGDYGGSYVAETLMAPLAELRAAYFSLREDPKFLAELDRDLRHYVGRP